MKNINLSLRASFSENGTSGFLLKDTTGIGYSKFISEVSEVSTTYYRTKDIIFLDLVNYNKLDGSKLTGFKNIITSDEDYTKYQLKYDSTIDGWFTIDHLVIPTLNYMHNFIIEKGSEKLPGETFYDGLYIVYNLELDSFLQLEIIDGRYTKSEITIQYIKDHLNNENLIGLEEQVFLIGYLEKCYEDMIKYILYNNLYEKCYYKDTDISTLYRNRDIIWMALDIIRRLINRCDFPEAERILERINTCNSFCPNLGKIGNKSKIGGCNC